ncbi:elongation factor 1-delta-like [Macaca thibetana thibetana]|uniref:elongation factor 1-delta-like n=1 Tax=Macaca thibetana thibetana TaxID=257877 RepID=UPI0021BC5830|nr:elongation factor 1-delta-like [Macaca thibetana thibetana]
MNGPVAGASRQENGASVILLILPEPERTSRNPWPEAQALGRLAAPVETTVSSSSGSPVWKWRTREARLNVLEKSLPGHQATAPQTQHVSPMRQVESPAKKPATAAEDDEDDDTDLLGSDSEAAQLREERLQQYAEKKVKKPALVARSSILLDIKPWDGETAMAHLEACVRFIQLDGLVWEASQLVPVGYGIWKLQIQCVVEDKVETDLGEEEITKFEERVQSVDMQLSTRSEA